MWTARVESCLRVTLEQAASVGAANDRIAQPKGKWYPRSKRRLWWVGHGNGYGFVAGLGNRSSYRQLHAGRTTRNSRTAKCIATRTVRSRSVGTHGNCAAARRRSEVQPLVLTGREPEQQGGVTDVSCSSSHAPLCMRCLSLAAVCFDFPKVECFAQENGDHVCSTL